MSVPASPRNGNLLPEPAAGTPSRGQTFAGTRIFPAKTPRRKDFWRNDAVFTGTPVEIRENSCQFVVKNFL